MISFGISMATAIGISLYTFFEAQALRHVIVQKLENFDTLSQVSLLNTFSNAVFFNPLTFALLVLVCYMAGVVWSLFRSADRKF